MDFSFGDKLAVITTDPFMGLTFIHVQRIAGDPVNRESNFNVLVIGLCYKVIICVILHFIVGESVVVLNGLQGRMNIVVWGPLKKTIIIH